MYIEHSKSQRREEKKKHNQRRERVRRNKRQEREKVGKFTCAGAVIALHFLKRQCPE